MTADFDKLLLFSLALLKQTTDKRDMTQIFGDFNEQLPPSEEYLVIQFSPSSIPLKQRWRNNGLSADFMADYVVTFFPTNQEDTNATAQQVEIKSAVSYIANELLENAMKFNDDTSPQPISIALHLYNDSLVFLTKNTVPPPILDDFQAYLQQLTTSDPQELYIHQLEQNAADETSTASRLGFLTMINDYMATVGWKFETLAKTPPVTTVTTMVRLMV